MIRYTEVIPSAQIQALSEISIEAACLLAGVPTPLIRFYRESPSGTIERPRRVAGYCAFLYNRPAIYVRADQPPQNLVATIFHEVFHGRILYHKSEQTRNHDEREAEARKFEEMVPRGDSANELHAELAKRLLKWSLKCGDFEAARRFHKQLGNVDAAAADELRDALLTPKERRLRIKMEAERFRRQTKSDVMVQEKVAEFKAWSEEQKRRQAW